MQTPEQLQHSLRMYHNLPSKVVNQYFWSVDEDYSLRVDEEWYLVNTEGTRIECEPEHTAIYLTMLIMDICRKTWYFMN